MRVSSIHQSLQRDLSSVRGLLWCLEKIYLPNLIILNDSLRDKLRKDSLSFILSSLNDGGTWRTDLLQWHVLELSIEVFVLVLIDTSSRRFWWIIERKIIRSCKLLISSSSFPTFSLVVWIFSIILLMILCFIILLGVHAFVLNNIVVMNFIINLILLNWVFLRAANLRVLG